MPAIRKTIQSPWLKKVKKIAIAIDQVKHEIATITVLYPRKTADKTNIDIKNVIGAQRNTSHALETSVKETRRI